MHTTRLRNHLEFDLSLLESRKSHREYLCLPKSNVGDAVCMVCLAAVNADKEARVLLNVFLKAHGFSGSFSTNDQATSVPPLFVSLVNMIWYG